MYKDIKDLISNGKPSRTEILTSHGLGTMTLVPFPDTTNFPAGLLIVVENEGSFFMNRGSLRNDPFTIFSLIGSGFSIETAEGVYRLLAHLLNPESGNDEVRQITGSKESKTKNKKQ
tara:strand:+ start:46 stop:396 length:351 start_codon:yes stop_codon:yes gene_type:complete